MCYQVLSFYVYILEVYYFQLVAIACCLFSLPANNTGTMYHAVISIEQKNPSILHLAWSEYPVVYSTRYRNNLTGTGNRERSGWKTRWRGIITRQRQTPCSCTNLLDSFNSRSGSLLQVLPNIKESPNSKCVDYQDIQ